MSRSKNPRLLSNTQRTIMTRTGLASAIAAVITGILGYLVVNLVFFVIAAGLFIWISVDEIRARRTLRNLSCSVCSFSFTKAEPCHVGFVLLPVVVRGSQVPRGSLVAIHEWCRDEFVEAINETLARRDGA